MIATRRNFIIGAAAVFIAGGIALPQALADDVADFYKGKQLNIVVGYGPGGGYDVYTRLLARHLGKYIPGNPTIVIQNMPGAGSLRAANYIYNVAPKDGSTLGVFSAPTALEPLFGNKNAQFETVKFNWIGNMFRDTAACATWNNTGIKGLNDVIDAKSPVAFGATGPGSYGNQHALVLKNMLGANLKVVTGYKGIKAVGLALERGEVQAACAMALSTVKATFDQNVKDGQLKFLVQFGKKNVPYFGDATNFYSLLKTDEQRRVADLFFGQSEIARPLIGPPGMKPEIVAALRKAMVSALKDKELLAEAAKIGIGIDPVSGEETAAEFVEFYKTPPEVVNKAKAIMGRK
jgi:tripartite-type tricarboxylate transporter receptor subunit TctC